MQTDLKCCSGSIVEEFEVALSAVSALQVPQVPSVCTYVRSRFVAALIEYRDLLLVGQLLPSSGPIIQPRPSYTNTVSCYVVLAYTAKQ